MRPIVTDRVAWSPGLSVTVLCNKSPAVAEMGDRLATIDTIGHNRPKSGEGLLGGLGSHLTQCGLGRGLY